MDDMNKLIRPKESMLGISYDPKTKQMRKELSRLCEREGGRQYKSRAEQEPCPHGVSFPDRTVLAAGARHRVDEARRCTHKRDSQRGGVVIMGWPAPLRAIH
jgi:hypothetical protein